MTVEEEPGLVMKFRSKLVIRNLPPGFTESQLNSLLLPWSEHIDYVSFHPGKVPPPFAGKSLKKSKAFLNFTLPEILLDFVQKMNEPWVDEYNAQHNLQVEIAPFQCPFPNYIPRRDPLCGTLETDEDFIKFVKGLEKVEETPVASLDEQLTMVMAKERELNPWKYDRTLTRPTPLLEHLKALQIAESATIERRNQEGRQKRKRGGKSKQNTLVTPSNTTKDTSKQSKNQPVKKAESGSVKETKKSKSKEAKNVKPTEERSLELLKQSEQPVERKQSSSVKILSRPSLPSNNPAVELADGKKTASSSVARVDRPSTVKSETTPSTNAKLYKQHSTTTESTTVKARTKPSNTDVTNSTESKTTERQQPKAQVRYTTNASRSKVDPSSSIPSSSIPSTTPVESTSSPLLSTLRYNTRDGDKSNNRPPSKSKLERRPTLPSSDQQ